MKVAAIGSGYVGLVVAACLSDLGNDVISVDIDEQKIANLKKGIIPIFEPGLSEMITRNLKQKRITFTTDLKQAVETAEVIFIGVGTPSNKDGSVDLTAVRAVAKGIGEHINGYKVIVDKSTVPVGTAEEVARIIKETSGGKHEFDVVSNPEFLKEGTAIQDFLSPDRIVVGAETEKAKKVMSRLYRGIARVNKPLVFTSVKSAELIKYASNAMLATRISFMNEIARFCEVTGADVKQVARGVGLDERVGPRFLQAGVGYGGSCFPKDVKGIIDSAKKQGCRFKILEMVEEVNEEQKQSLLPKVETLVGDLKGKTVAVWGLAFKPKTDDIRDAPSRVLIKQLLDKGASIRAFDPEATENMKKVFADLTYCENPYAAAEGADCIVLVTEWHVFRDLDKQRIAKSMNTPNFVDGRNIYDPVEMKEAGFSYISVGRPRP